MAARRGRTRRGALGGRSRRGHRQVPAAPARHGRDGRRGRAGRRDARELSATHPTVEARDGRATAIPLADASVDAVVCAQAFHWFATVDALDEIHRVLRPGGVLALVWNVRDETVPWVKRMTEVLSDYEGDVPRFHRGTWRTVFPARGFGLLDEARFPHVHRGPAEQVFVDRAMSISFVAALPASEQRVVRSRLEAIVAAEPTLRGTVDFPYETRAYRTVRT